MEVLQSSFVLLLLVLAFQTPQIKCGWERPKLEHCELHPDMELRIQRDVGFWGEGGISEEVSLSVCRFCDLPPETVSSSSSSGNHHHHHRRRSRRLHQAQQQRLQDEQELMQQQSQQQQQHQQRQEQEQQQQQEQEQQQQGRHHRQRHHHHLRRDVSLEDADRGGRLLRSAAGVAPECNKPQRVLIRDGTVYLTNLVAADHIGPFEHIGFLVELYEASQLYRLPDVEFTYWFGDNAPAYTQIKPDGTTTWPYSQNGGTPAIVAWSKWDENAALVVPYSGAFRCPTDSWDAIESQLETLTTVPWSSRREVAFGRWNGFCTHYIPWMKTADGQVMKCPRTYLGTLAEAHPDILDTYDLGRAKPVPLAHQNVYKYIVSTDGWSISSKFDKYLLIGSAIFKAASTRYGFYYDAIKPYQHYLPFMVNSSDDIVDMVIWAKSHDDRVRRVAEEGQRFALQNLNRQARLCYLFRLMTELSKKMRYKPSCERRQLCVPLVREIRFLRSYQRTAASCRYQEVLLRYGSEDPSDVDPDSDSDTGDSSPKGPLPAGVRAFSLQELQQLHESGTAWPRDDLLQPPKY